MTDEDKKIEETTEETVEETPAAEAPAEAPVAEDAPAEEAPAEEASADEAPAGEAPAEENAAPAAAAAEEAGEAQPVLSPKQIRRTKRSTHKGEARAARTPEERAAERAERRSSRAAARRSYRATQKTKAAAKPAAEPAVGTPKPEREPGNPKVRQGVVVSDKADKTITVRIDVTRRHRQYKKTIRSSSTLHAHDEQNEANAGDTVRVIESRPLSRLKRWRLVEVVERAR